MFYMMKNGTEFSYDHYHSIRNIDVFNIPAKDLVLINHDFKHYIRILMENDIHTTIKMEIYHTRSMCKIWILLRGEHF